jgi:hypothetical protein
MHKLPTKLQSIRKRIQARIKSALIETKYVRTGLDFVNNILHRVGAPALAEEEYQSIILEVEHDLHLKQTHEKHIDILNKNAPHKPSTGWEDFLQKRPMLAGINIFYVLPRVLRPSILVETGVAAGSMTRLVLAALNKNNHGHLYSIDLPAHKGDKSIDWSLSSALNTGFLIPSLYRDRWSLIAEDATYALPRLFEQQKKVDFFIHDSLHIFSHMLLEYSLAVAHMNNNSVIVSDDITMNSAFLTFFETLGYPIFIESRNRNVGVAVATNTNQMEQQ